MSNVKLPNIMKQNSIGCYRTGIFQERNVKNINLTLLPHTGEVWFWKGSSLKVGTLKKREGNRVKLKHH